MIQGTMFDYTRYWGMNSVLPQVFKYITSVDWVKMEPGRHEIAGTDVYINLDINRQKDVSDTFEAHRKYIDLQFIIDGDEEILYAPLQNLSIHREYNEEKDICLLKGTEYSTLVLHTNEWVIFYPDDAHAVCQKHNSETCIKVVAKIPVEN